MQAECQSSHAFSVSKGCVSSVTAWKNCSFSLRDENIRAAGNTAQNTINVFCKEGKTWEIMADFFID